MTAESQAPRRAERLPEPLGFTHARASFALSVLLAALFCCVSVLPSEAGTGASFQKQAGVGKAEKPTKDQKPSKPAKETKPAKKEEPAKQKKPEKKPPKKPVRDDKKHRKDNDARRERDRRDRHGDHRGDRDRPRRDVRQEEPVTQCSQFVQTKTGPGLYFHAFSQLPSFGELPKEVVSLTLSGLVKVQQEAVLFDGLVFLRKKKDWVMEGIKGLSNGGATRLAALSEAGVVPHDCAEDPAALLKRLPAAVREGRWDEVLLDSTWKLDPDAKSLVDEINADLKACGKKRYVENLGRLPKPGLMAPSLWFLLMKVELSAASGADFVELGLVPVKDSGFRVASLRVVCTR